MDDTIKDADLQSDKQTNDLEIVVNEDESQDTASQAQGNTEDPSDKLTPEHPRFKEVLNRAKTAEEKAAELEQRLAQLEEERDSKSNNDYSDDEELTEAERVSLEKIQRNLAKRGFVTEDSLRVKERAENLTKLAEVHNGKDGLPKFNSVEVVAYAKQKGFGENYEAAYKDLHFDAIVEANALKRANANQAPTSEKPSGGGATGTGTKRFTRQDISNMSTAEYLKYRDSLKAAIKPKDN